MDLSRSPVEIQNYDHLMHKEHMRIVGDIPHLFANKYQNLILKFSRIACFITTKMHVLEQIVCVGRNMFFSLSTKQVLVDLVISIHPLKGSRSQEPYIVWEIDALTH